MPEQRADQVVDIPGVGAVAFPGSMTDAQINAAATRLYKQANPEKKQPPVKTWTDTAVSWLPTAGSVIGGMMGVETGPLGIAAGAGAGGALGKAIEQKINVMRGVQEEPATVMDALAPVAKEGGIDAALAGTGGLVAKGAKALAPLAGAGLDAAGMAVEKAGAKGITKWLNEEVAQIAGRGIQAASRTMTGAPNEAGMIRALIDAATRPTRPIVLNAAESKFLPSIEARLAGGQPLTVPQKAWLKSIYRAKLP